MGQKKKKKDQKKIFGNQQKKNHENGFWFKYQQEIPRLPQGDHHCLKFHISQYTRGETSKPETCEDMDSYHLPSEMQDISAYFQNIAAKNKTIEAEKSVSQPFLKVLNRTCQNKKHYSCTVGSISSSSTATDFLLWDASWYIISTFQSQITFGHGS